MNFPTSVAGAVVWAIIIVVCVWAFLQIWPVLVGTFT